MAPMKSAGRFVCPWTIVDDVFPFSTYTRNTTVQVQILGDARCMARINVFIAP